MASLVRQCEFKIKRQSRGILKFNQSSIVCVDIRGACAVYSIHLCKHRRTKRHLDTAYLLTLSCKIIFALDLKVSEMSMRRT